SERCFEFRTEHPHLLPHAVLELNGRLDDTMPWVLAGFFGMFLLERAFRSHAHHAADGTHDGHCQGAHERHDQASNQHHGHSPAAGKPSAHGHRWAWCGAFSGLALHSLADGAALAAAVDADGGGLLAGFAAFLAIVLHKPFDAGIIATLMIQSGASAKARRLVNAIYALVVPLGAVVFLLSLQFFGGDRSPLLGIALALAAGAFLCIAAADLLPEVEFHSHDRLLLSAALALGITIAWGITVVERSSHAHRGHGGRLRLTPHRGPGPDAPPALRPAPPQ
ncbi:MAG: ZIP family metal transporter, partial [Planctomycetota bacterium]